MKPSIIPTNNNLYQNAIIWLFIDQELAICGIVIFAFWFALNYITNPQTYTRKSPKNAIMQ